MARLQTTHVLEIETGIGEPAFIPICMGQELAPISVGKKGMWRLESARVLDVHAFFYFDGTALFVQSADEQNAASVDGHRVGKAWTELRAPCKIDVGAARLRFRSLIADDDEDVATPATGTPAIQPQAAPAAATPMRAPSGPPPPNPSGSTPQMSFPKPERPFRPGEFASQPDLGASTRVAPLDNTMGGRTSGQAPSRPPPNDTSGRSGPQLQPSGHAPVMGSGPYGPPGLPGQAPGISPMQPGSVPPGGTMATGGGMAAFPSGGYAPQPGFTPPPGYAAQAGYGGAVGSGSFGAMHAGAGIPGPPGMPGALGPGMPPGGYGSMTPHGGLQQAPAPEGAGQQLLAMLKASSMPKLIAGVIFILGAILYLADDDEPQAQPPKKNVAALDGGAVDASAATGAATTAGGGPSSTAASGSGASTGPTPTAPPVMAPPGVPAWPPGVPCPPPHWPPNTPLPCAPNGLAAPPDQGPDKGAKDAGKSTEKAASPAALAAGTKTLERQAVDYVASGNTAKAAAAYEELARNNPTNKVYSEAARILRAKLDGGAAGH